MRLNSRTCAQGQKPKRPRNRWRSAFWLAVIVTGLGTGIATSPTTTLVVPGTDTPMSMSALD
jgi:hypothetical protein